MAKWIWLLISLLYGVAAAGNFFSGKSGWLSLAMALLTFAMFAVLLKDGEGKGDRGEPGMRGYPVPKGDKGTDGARLTKNAIVRRKKALRWRRRHNR